MPTLKALARKPAFTLGVVGMFALGIAASTAIFSIFNGLFLASLPYPAADRLVFLSEIAPGRNLRQIGASFLDLENWRSSTQAFDHVAGFHDAGGYNLSGAEGPVRVHGALVTSDMGATLGIK
ncbi:MAG TPA: hypothetical protein VMB85_09675, partial [Bryobacteraceae bacterium]|nr:hypothetical protein [Bryobacteraceae bacterium]